MRQLSSTLLVIFGFVFLSSCSNIEEKPKEETPAPPTIKLGEVRFEVSGDAAAQPYFKKGLLLLHSFEYEDARAEFVKAQELDSTFAMAYWGEAMTYNHSLWQRQEKEKALDALNKLAPDVESRAALIPTELEADFFKAIEILFGEGTKYDRDVAYKDFMKSLTEKYPTHHEVSAFYAISLLASSRNGRDEELYGKSAQIAQSIIKENPGHPGALHYLIHSYDDPKHAPLAKQAADDYSKIAPDAAHALHMPSHIYVALGQWDAVVNSNIASWNADVKRIERKSLDAGALNYHAFNWLQYGLLQRGETQQATTILTNMIQYSNDKDTKVVRSYLIAMKGGHMVETNSWEGEIADLPIEIKDLNITKRAGYHFLEGMKAYHQKDQKLLGNAIKAMKKDRSKAKIILGDGSFSMCSTAGFANKPANQLDIDMVHVMEMELEAFRATLLGKKDKAAAWFEKASQLDAGLSYSYGPPTILKPIDEAYGEWLLEHNKPQAALVAFEKSLVRYPRRLRSLKGKKMAAKLLKNEAILTEVNEELAVSMAKKERAPVLYQYENSLREI